MEVVNLDLLTYAGNPENLEALKGDPRHTFVQGDICDEPLVRDLLKGVGAVINLAAESHVDRSIENPTPFVRTNVLGTRVLLDAALEVGVPRFVQVSTDEVYGELPWADPESDSLDKPLFTEETPLRPRSPYAASKAAADLLALAYATTYGQDIVIARGSNNYGPYQHQEKLIPRVITRAILRHPVPLYGDGLHIRDWIWVEDFCAGILAALERGHPGEVYNFGGGEERTNLQVVHAILLELGAPDGLIEFAGDRPGHDRRYGMDSSKAREALGWEPREDFEVRLRETVEWYRMRLRR
jgi:dTDP-glucose 4,6-dehydratase